MGATACLLWLFGAAGIACTYLFSFAFLVRTTFKPSLVMRDVHLIAVIELGYWTLLTNP